MGLFQQFMPAQATGFMPAQAPGPQQPPMAAPQQAPQTQGAPAHSLQLTPELIRMMELWVQQQKAAGNPQFQSGPAPGGPDLEAMAAAMRNISGVKGQGR